MQAVDEKMETIHLYVVREQPKQPFTVLPIVVALLCIGALIGVTYYSALHPAYQYEKLIVPAQPLPPQTFTASMPVIPTGVKTYPVAIASGILTITNGSVIAQVIPAGFTIQSVATDRAVYIPAGNANGYGYAVVPAHALTAGNGGNFARLTINQVIGSSVYVRNLSAFTGGRDAYSVKYVTAQDRQSALIKARGLVALKITGLHYPCRESLLRSALANTVTWRCQFVTYHLPAYMRVIAAHLSGRNILIDVVFLPRPARMWAK